MHPPPLIKILKIGKFWVFCFKFFFLGGGFSRFSKESLPPFPPFKNLPEINPIKISKFEKPPRFK